MASDENERSKPDSQKTVITTAAPTGVAMGTQIMGTFEITEHIATGGMGEVYRGVNIHTQEPVAIKIVLAALAHDEKIMNLFQKEAMVLGRLHHDAIVRYMLFTVDPGIQRACLVMEFVEGRSLADYYGEEGRMPVEDVRVMMRRVASGLQKAHDLGVVHRDLSPDNVVIQDGLISHTKIIDFGIAKSANFGGGTLLGGQFAGKYGYVSPEQLGRFKGVIDGRSDIYSLALVAAAACRGEPIDMGDSPAEAVERRMDVPDLSGVDDDLRQLLEMMLQPDPANRPASMEKVLEYLENPALIPGAGAAAPQGSVPPQGAVPPQGSVPPQTYPPQQSYPPGQTYPPEQSQPPGATRISQPPAAGYTTPPQHSTPPEQNGADSPFGSPDPAQQTGVGGTLPPGTVPPAAAPGTAREKGGKGGLIAALLALAVIGGGAGAYFGGLIPGVGPAQDAGGSDAVAGADTPATGATASAGGAGGGGTVRFDDSGNPVNGAADPQVAGVEAGTDAPSEPADGAAATGTADSGNAGTAGAGAADGTADTASASTGGSDPATTGTPTTGGTDAGTGTTTETAAAQTDSAQPGSADTAPSDQIAAAMTGGAVDPVDSTIDPTEGDPIATDTGGGAAPDLGGLETIGKMIAWVRNYSTPRCVHVGLRSAVPGDIEIEGYATSVDPFWELLTQFRDAFGTEPKIGVRLVDESQCSVVTFVKNLTRSDARAPNLRIDKDVLKPGEPIRGTIDRSEGRDLTLFLIDSEGGAYNLTSRLKPQPDGSSTFALALRPQGAAGREIVPYLMLAIASAAPIGSADTPAGTPTSSLMPIIQAEIRQRGASEQDVASAALGYFRFDDAAGQ